MNPLFDPSRPETAPGSPTLVNALSASTGGDPTISGGGGGGGMTAVERESLRAQREAERQARGAAHRQMLAQRPGTTPTTPTPDAGPRPTPTGGANYYMGGNIGNSAPGREQDPAWRPAAMQESYRGTYDQWRNEMAQTHPWMADTSILWGGGAEGYLPIGYQAQDYRYYQQQPGLVTRQGPTGRYYSRQEGPGYAPWEDAYRMNTWTQNIDPSQPGYYDPQRVQNDPNYNPRA